MSQDSDSQDRPALSEETPSGGDIYGIVGSGKRFAKGLKRLSRSLQEIDQRWKNRLIFEKIVPAKDYFAGRFAFVAEIGWGLISEPDYRAYVSISYNDANVVSASEVYIPDDGTAHLQHEHVMFIPIAEFVEGNDRFIPTIGEIAVRFYRVRKEKLRLLSGPTYRRLDVHSYEALPIVSNRHRRFLDLSTGSSNQAHPGDVESRSHVRHDIPSDKRNLCWNLPAHADLESVGRSLRVRFQEGYMGLRFVEGVTDRLKLLKAYVGPFEL